MSGLDWHFKRTGFAHKMLRRIELGAGEPLLLISPPQTGRTSFLRNDFEPAARERGYEFVHINLLGDVDHPEQAILAALQEAIEAHTLPDSALERIAKTPVKSISMFGAGLDLGDPDAPRETPGAALQIAERIGKLASLSKRKLIIAIDDIECLAATAQCNYIAAALRTALERHKNRCACVFSASSDYVAREMFGRPDTPLYQFATSQRLPALDSGFVDHCATIFRKETRLPVDRVELEAAFEAFGRRPRPFVRLVTELIAEMSSDVKRFRDDQLVAMREESNLGAVWSRLSPLEQQVMQRISAGHSPLTKSALENYARSMNRERILLSSAQQALDTLCAKKLVVRDRRDDTYRIAFQGFAEWLSGSIRDGIRSARRAEPALDAAREAIGEEFSGG